MRRGERFAGFWPGGSVPGFGGEARSTFMVPLIHRPSRAKGPGAWPTGSPGRRRSPAAGCRTARRRRPAAQRKEYTPPVGPAIALKTLVSRAVFGMRDKRYDTRDNE